MALTEAEEKRLLELLELEEKENEEVTEKQRRFINSPCDEVLYGGAAGGGKSYGQLVDAFRKARDYPGIRQLMLRRTFPELKRSLILVSHTLIPNKMATYNSSDHFWKFKNGSVIEFGCCDSEADVTKYQSAEYDIIRFDELTHFTEFQYTYLISRIRGANKFPKQIKSSTNPGGVGHSWVKSRFIDGKVPEKIYTDEHGRTSVFIPAKVRENSFLMDADPMYIQRLEQLPESQRKALLDGEWDIFEGQYFTEFRTDIHVVSPFIIPAHWKRYNALDYGLDMLAGYWFAIDTQGNVYVYKEVYEKNLIITDAAERLKAANGSDALVCRYGPPDLWNRRQDTGKSAADIFAGSGWPLVKTKNDRVNGWYSVKEWLKPVEGKDEQTGEKTVTSKLKIFSTCINLIRALPQLQFDEKDPNDVATEPHELTHAPDALRYFCCMRQSPAVEAIAKRQDDFGIYNDNTEDGELDESYIYMGVKH